MNSKQIAETRTYKIYRHSLPNGIAYVGTTSMEKLYMRFQYGNGYSHQIFGDLVAEYGWSQVKTEILETIEGTYKDATIAEAYWVRKSIADGYNLCNKHYAKEKEAIYRMAGCTIVDRNMYFPTFKAAADYIGVTKAAISYALNHSGVCKGYTLTYGDMTKTEEEK